MPTDTEAREALERIVAKDYSPPGIIEQMESDIATLRAYIERAEKVWALCRVVYYPPDFRAYPIEHAPFAGKDMREAIEAALDLIPEATNAD